MPDLRIEALRRAHLEDAVVVIGRRLAGEQHEGLAAQLAQRHGGLARQGVVMRHAAQEGFAMDQRGGQLVGHTVGVDKAGIQPIMQQRVDLLL